MQNNNQSRAAQDSESVFSSHFFVSLSVFLKRHSLLSRWSKGIIIHHSSSLPWHFILVPIGPIGYCTTLLTVKPKRRRLCQRQRPPTRRIERNDSTPRMDHSILPETTTPTTMDDDTSPNYILQHHVTGIQTQQLGLRMWAWHASWVVSRDACSGKQFTTTTTTTTRHFSNTTTTITSAKSNWWAVRTPQKTRIHVVRGYDDNGDNDDKELSHVPPFHGLTLMSISCS